MTRMQEVYTNVKVAAVLCSILATMNLNSLIYIYYSGHSQSVLK